MADYTSKFSREQIDALLDKVGSVNINNQDKIIDIIKNGTTEVVADSGYTGLGKVSVNVNVPTSGGATQVISVNDVNFYDYDGTLLHSYTKDAFLALNELPPLPTQQGLTCQEWNYTLSGAKECLAEYGKLNIGATYITDDGKTRLYINIAEAGRFNVPLYFSQTVSNGVVIDWGDGSATETISGTGNLNTIHTYASVGEYVITLDVADGCTLGLGHNANNYCVMGSTGNSTRVYCNMLQKVELGKGIVSLDSFSFYYCHSLATIVIPKNVTSLKGYNFYNCYYLKAVVIPNSIVELGSNMFQNCYSLENIILQEGVISIGNSLLYGCYSLSSIVFPKDLESLGENAFQNCYSLSTVNIPNKLLKISASMFNNCSSLQSVNMPNSVETISSYAFQNCVALQDVNLSEALTHIESSFVGCYSLSKIVFPKSITNIGATAFRICYGMALYDFSQLKAIPTLANTNAFQSIPSDCKIIVPDALYDEWIAATNWSTYASYIIKKSEWDSLNA